MAIRWRTVAASETGRRWSIGSSAPWTSSIASSAPPSGYPMAIRAVNRSRCASGSGYVPSISIGFCVAITMNGVCSRYVTPSTVTWRSSMHSNSADWVFGEARLISSPTTMLANTAPGLNSKSRFSWLKTLTPVTSLGSRSGVNWIRRTVQSIERASALASLVLPTPGTSSMSRWPSASMTARASRTIAVLPSITRSMLSTIAVVTAANSGADIGRPSSSAVLGMVTGLLLKMPRGCQCRARHPRSGRRDVPPSTFCRPVWLGGLCCRARPRPVALTHRLTLAVSTAEWTVRGNVVTPVRVSRRTRPPDAVHCRHDPGCPAS
ncbi:MAG: hypothetical protein AUI14_06670 [Actinobacteria bacterium 13_2_20CM_2_71_6]|nr:MAG: hypothetical protein AUI14_06670 [Actinobacteria bacterium 13_2_20CM_2_71_6]